LNIAFLAAHTYLTSKKWSSFMQTLATTKMTTKGQVVIPEAIRKELNLEAGNQFIVVAHGDTVILKTIQPPAIKQFKALMNEAQAKAKAIGMKKSDIDEATKAVRAGK
jgi:AbrB family looped-hinge helix DNA binding protein